MAQPFVGEIQIFAGNFAPAGWVFCDGSLLAISENETLFNLIGTTYGGDGQSTFAVPDLRGRIPLHQGQGPGLPNYVLGQTGGVEEVTLTTNTMPSHSHPYLASADPGSGPTPVGTVAASSNAVKIYKTGVPATPMNASSILASGGNQPHSNLQPFIVINYIISLFGIYPSPN